MPNPLFQLSQIVSRGLADMAIRENLAIMKPQSIESSVARPLFQVPEEKFSLNDGIIRRLDLERLLSELPMDIDPEAGKPTIETIPIAEQRPTIESIPIAEQRPTIESIPITNQKPVPFITPTLEADNPELAELMRRPYTQGKEIAPHGGDLKGETPPTAKGGEIDRDLKDLTVLIPKVVSGKLLWSGEAFNLGKTGDVSFDFSTRQALKEISQIIEIRPDLLEKIPKPIRQLASINSGEIEATEKEIVDLLSKLSPTVAKGGEIKTIYHGTDKDFKDFDVSKSADGSIWFTDNKSKIEGGEVAASGKGKIIERSIDESKLKLGGWEENDKYSTDELIAQGYDGLKLVDKDETTYQIFNPSKLSPTK